MILPKSFYNRNTLQVAQDLLGCFLVRQIGNKKIKAMIVETEAYHGPSDKASHASRGRTERNAVMFDEAGKIYVYLVYGMHSMLNIVTGAKGYPAAVLIRAVELVAEETKSPIGDLVSMSTNGPAKLTKALQINKRFNKLPVYTKKHGLWVESRAEDLCSSQIVRAKRIGVDYAEEYKDKKWRLYIKDNISVSRKEEEG